MDLPEWWQLIGLPSLIAGATFGFLWSCASTWRRRVRYRSRGIAPGKQVGWFLLSLLGMGGYLTLVAAIGLLAVHDVLPAEAVWTMLGTAVVAFSAALLVGRFEEPRAFTERVDEMALREEPQPRDQAAAAPRPAGGAGTQTAARH